MLNRRISMGDDPLAGFVHQSQASETLKMDRVRVREGQNGVTSGYARTGGVNGFLAHKVVISQKTENPSMLKIDGFS